MMANSHRESHLEIPSLYLSIIGMALLFSFPLLSFISWPLYYIRYLHLHLLTHVHQWNNAHPPPHLHSSSLPPYHLQHRFSAILLLITLLFFYLADLSSYYIFAHPTCIHSFLLPLPLASQVLLVLHPFLASFLLGFLPFFLTIFLGFLPSLLLSFVGFFTSFPLTFLHSIFPTFLLLLAPAFLPFFSPSLTSFLPSFLAFFLAWLPSFLFFDPFFLSFFLF